VSEPEEMLPRDDVEATDVEMAARRYMNLIL
jgi:hypothetical protein